MLSESDKITTVLLYAAHNHGVPVFSGGGGGSSDFRSSVTENICVF